MNVSNIKCEMVLTLLQHTKMYCPVFTVIMEKLLICNYITNQPAHIDLNAAGKRIHLIGLGKNASQSWSQCPRPICYDWKLIPVWSNEMHIKAAVD